jgi:ESS family glutamate:Na+ symporter
MVLRQQLHLNLKSYGLVFPAFLVPLLLGVVVTNLSELNTKTKITNAVIIQTYLSLLFING